MIIFSVNPRWLSHWVQGKSCQGNNPRADLIFCCLAASENLHYSISYIMHWWLRAWVYISIVMRAERCNMCFVNTFLAISTKQSLSQRNCLHIRKYFVIYIFRVTNFRGYVERRQKFKTVKQFKIQIFIVIFGFSRENAFNWIQASLVLVQWFLR